MDVRIGFGFHRVIGSENAGPHLHALALALARYRNHPRPCGRTQSPRMREPEYSPAATGIHPWSSASAKMDGVESESEVQPKVTLSAGGLARGNTEMRFP